MRATSVRSVWMRATLVLAAAGGAMSASACNELDGADQLVESPCYPLPPSQCGLEAGSDAGADASGGDGPLVDSTVGSDAGDGAIEASHAEGGCLTGELECDGGCVANDPHNCGAC